MKKPEFCPYCQRKLEKKGMMTYACKHCKVRMYIQVECEIDSPILKGEDSAQTYDWVANEEGLRIHHFE